MKTMRMQRLVLSAVVVLFALLSGCAGKWAMRTETSPTQLLWPDMPERPRVKYIASIQGFEESEPSFVSSVLFGKRKEGTLIRPVAVVVGSDGRVAIADTGCKCVHLFIPKEQKYISIHGAGPVDLLSPVGVAFDDALRLFVSDSALGQVLLYSGEGDFLKSMETAGPAKLKRPTGLAFDQERKLLYVADTAGSKIYAVRADGSLALSIGGRGVGDGQFNFPTHIFWSPAGRLYVTDSMNFRVQMFDSSGRFVGAFGRHGDGSGDYAMPKGIAVDSKGVIYVVDSLFDNIQLFGEKGEFFLTIGHRGGGLAEFWLPSGAYMDDHEKLYICDTFNERVQIFEIVRDIHE